MIDWHAIDTVLLDMDGTLLDLHFDNFFWQEHVPRQYALRNNMHPEQAWRLLEERIGRHEGTLNWYCLDFWSRELDLDIAALKRAQADRIALRPQAEAFLRALKKARLRTLLVTNAHPDAMNLKLERTGIGEHFDRIVSSHEYGAPKEHPDFWHRLQAREPFVPARTLLVDDSLRVLGAARDWGVGHLVSIAQPDSQRPPRDTHPFPAITHFQDIMPGARP